MQIERVQVEEGFLDGLDLAFVPGLNVLIGPRGTGKTSVIELIRFCLGVEALTQKTSRNATEHALAILGSGKVTVTLSDSVTKLHVSRSAEHWLSSATGVSLIKPLVLSQNEIESLGIDVSGRLRLIDSLRPPRSTALPSEEVLLNFIRSRSEERRSLSEEVRSIRTQIREISEQLQLADSLKAQHLAALNSIGEAKAETERLAVLDSWLSQLSVRAELLKRSQARVQQWQGRISELMKAAALIEQWPSAAGGADQLQDIRSTFEAAEIKMLGALTDVTSGQVKLQALVQQNESQMLGFQEEARTLRGKLNALQQGAGDIARKLTHLTERQGQMSALNALLKDKEERMKEVQRARKAKLDDIEMIRESRYEVRLGTIRDLNQIIGPRVSLKIERAGQTAAYADAIVAALRGSNLRVAEVAPSIADQISPREFVEIVENEDVAALSQLVDIAPTRAARIIERINSHGVEAILTAEIDDGVEISLLDGREYKATTELSTGQRCTAVLPILLNQEPLFLLMDQPEDHLDNAFIVDTLVRTVNARKSAGQIICTTHNPNIPVLGNADRVILMGSDGGRGFVKQQGILDQPEIVNAIASVMEGGLDAFKLRSKFYKV